MEGGPSKFLQCWREDVSRKTQNRMEQNEMSGMEQYSSTSETKVRQPFYLNCTGNLHD